MNKIITLIMCIWITACSVDYAENNQLANRSDKGQSIEVSYPMTKKGPVVD